jgi:Protein of unknown function (DUF3732)
MQFQIKELILWPKREGLSPRRVKFTPGRVNVITGWSKTGKSAVIPIIDYCLGSDSCTIPVNTIRDATSWFGLLVETDASEYLFARREPGGTKATGDMIMLEGRSIDVPETIEGLPRTNVQAVKGVLDTLAGLSHLDFDYGGSGSGSKGRPSFRDMVAFTFQPQNVVANPDVLFYKADTTEHREKLKTIFPYVLGAITPEILGLQHELQTARQDLTRKEREFERLRQHSIRWTADITAKVAVARELGLLDDTPLESAPEMISALRQVVEATDETVSMVPQQVVGAAAEVSELAREEAEVASRLTQLKRRYSDMTTLRHTSSDIHGALAIKRDRLKISDWIRDLQIEEYSCPMCGTQPVESSSAVEELHQALRRTEQEVAEFAVMPAAFDREYRNVREEIARATEQLSGVQIRRRAAENWSSQPREGQYSLAARARFIGGLDEALSRYDDVESDGDLSKYLEELRERVVGLEGALKKADVAGSTNRARRRFSLYASRVLPSLDVENPNEAVSLSTTELTVSVSGGGRENYLWEIGSGANWLAYHIATSIALHEMFLEMPQSPVPSFVVYDQPSQVYFPNRARPHGEAEEDEGRKYRDEDIEAVQKIFRTLADAVLARNGRWQAIVLDHADKDIWGDMAGIQLVEEWRGEKLVPLTWLT